MKPTTRDILSFILSFDLLSILLTCLFTFSLFSQNIYFLWATVAFAGIRTLSHFIPKREDYYLKQIQELRDELTKQRTDISKLNVTLGIAVQRENARDIGERSGVFGR